MTSHTTFTGHCLHFSCHVFELLPGERLDEALPAWTDGADVEACTSDDPTGSERALPSAGWVGAWVGGWVGPSSARCLSCVETAWACAVSGGRLNNSEASEERGARDDNDQLIRAHGRGCFFLPNKAPLPSLPS